MAKGSGEKCECGCDREMPEGTYYIHLRLAGASHAPAVKVALNHALQDPEKTMAEKRQAELEEKERAAKEERDRQGPDLGDPRRF